MICSNCGKEFNDRSKFCPYCGQAAGSTAGTPVEPALRPAYDAPAYTAPAAPAAPSRSGVAKASLILGIIGFAFVSIGLIVAFLPVVGFISLILGILGSMLCLPAMILGIIGLKSATARGQALTGMILGIVGMVLTVLIIVVAFGLVFCKAAAPSVAYSPYY